MKQKMISFALSLCVLLGLMTAVPFSASAEASGTCGDDLTWILDNEGVLTINGTGDMWDWEHNNGGFYDTGGAPWFSMRYNVKKIVIGANVSTIGTEAFCGCRNMTGVLIPKSITDIGNDAFYACSNLKDLTIPSSVKNIDDSAFMSCSNLANVEIQVGVKSLGNSVFRLCSNLKSLTIPKSVTSIGSAAFSGCSSLTSITIPESITSISAWMFSDCSQLTSVMMSDAVTNIGYGSFVGCTSLNSITIPNGVTIIDDIAFQGCSNLARITIPNSIMQIGDSIFRSCRNLSDIYYSGTSEQWKILFANADVPSNTKIHYGSGNSFTPVNTNPSKPDDGSSKYAYGVAVKKSQEEADIREQLKESAERFNKAALEYIATLSKSAKKTAGTVDDIKELAKRLESEYDEQNGKRISFITQPDSKAKTAAFMGYANYLNQMIGNGISLNKIDLSDNSVMIDYRLTKEILSKMKGKKLSYDYKGYRVNINALSFSNSYMGTLDVISPNGQKISAMIVSDINKTTEDLQDYANQLKNVAQDVNKQALRAVANDLVNLSGLGELGKLIARDGLKSYKPLTKMGYGDVVKNVKKCYNGYEAIKEILNCTNIDTLDSIIENPQKLAKKLGNLCEYEENIANAAVNAAQSKLENAIYNLFYDACDYEDMIEGNKPQLVDEIKGFFGEFSSWVSSHFQCPVDFTVYDENGEMIGYVNDGAIYYNDEIYIEIEGDVKKLYVPVGMNVDIKMTGTDEGEFNYVVEEVIYNEPTGRLNYYNLPLSEGTVYTQNFETSKFANDTEVLPVLSDDGNILANEYISSEDTTAYVIVDVKSGEGGTVLGGGEYAKGDSVEVTAIPKDSNYIFNGWYIGDELISTDSVYRFTAVENISVYAKFMREYASYDAYDMQVSEQYDDFYSYIYKDADGAKGIILVPFNDENTDNMQIYVTTYATDGSVLNENVFYSTTLNENGIYAFGNVDFKNAAKIVIKSENGIEIASSEYNSIKQINVFEGFSDSLNAQIHNVLGNTSIIFEILNDTEVDINAYYAKYNENGELLSCIILEGTNINNEIKYDVRMSENEKLMFWNSNMEPITEVIISDMLGM